MPYRAALSNVCIGPAGWCCSSGTGGIGKLSRVTATCAWRVRSAARNAHVLAQVDGRWLELLGVRNEKDGPDVALPGRPLPVEPRLTLTLRPRLRGNGEGTGGAHITAFNLALAAILRVVLRQKWHRQRHAGRPRPARIVSGDG